MAAITEHSIQNRPDIIKPLLLQDYDPKAFQIIVDAFTQFADALRSNHRAALPPTVLRTTGSIVLGHTINPRDALFYRNHHTIQGKDWGSGHANSVVLGRTIRSADPGLKTNGRQTDWDNHTVFTLEALPPEGRELPESEQVSVEIDPDSVSTLTVYPENAMPPTDTLGRFDPYTFLHPPSLSIRPS